MDSLTLIITLCTVMWYIIDNLKENFWGKSAYSNLITISASALGSLGLCFGYKLDLIYALGIVSESGIMGYIITALSMMGGSALVSEIVEMFRKKLIF